MNAPARFKQSDVTRAVKGAEAAGMRVGSVEIDIHGNIMVHVLTSNQPTAKRNSVDEILRR